MIKLSDKKVLVTGGLGFIGINFVNYLLRHGVAVCNVDACTYASNPPDSVEDPKTGSYMFREGSINNLEFIFSIIRDYRPEFIVNFAAETHVDNSIEAPDKFVQTNINGTFNLLTATRKHLLSKTSTNFKKFLNVSTDEVYGTLGSSGIFTEETSYSPNSPYSASKAAADMMVRSFVKTYNFPAVTTNCSNNFGPHQHPEKLIPKVIMRAINDMDIPVYGNGKNIRDWLFVSDHVEALSTLLFSETLHDKYNIGGGQEFSNVELIHKILEILKEKKAVNTNYNKIIFIKDRPGHDFRYAVDDSRFRKEFNKNTGSNFISNLELTIDWYLTQKD